MSAAIVKVNGEVKEVKNLGWLIKHWTEVKSFEVETSGIRCVKINGKFIPVNVLNGNQEYDAVLIARLKDGGAYVTPFADKGVLLNWLDRAVFYGLNVNWFGVNLKLEHNSATHLNAKKGNI